MPEFRFAELRASGRTLAGTAMRYGDTADVFGMKERFETGSIVPASDGVILNLQHDRARPLARSGGGGLELRDSADALGIEATLPMTREADDALELVRAGVLRGLSVEFEVLRERFVDGVRIVSRAILTGIGLVDRPAYPQSVVEARQSAAGARIKGSLAYGAPIVVGTPDGQRQAATKEVWARGAFDYAIRDTTREINLVLGDYAQPLASRQAGTLALESTDDALLFGAPLPSTTYAADFVTAQREGAAAYRAMPRFTIPPLEGAVEYQTEAGTGSVIRVVKEAVLSAIAIVARAPRAAAASEPDAEPVYGMASTLSVENGARRRRLMI